MSVELVLYLSSNLFFPELKLTIPVILLCHTTCTQVYQVCVCESTLSFRNDRCISRSNVSVRYT